MLEEFFYIKSSGDLITVEEAKELVELERRIIESFNSNEYAVEQNIKLGRNYNNLMNQVVGAETD